MMTLPPEDKLLIETVDNPGAQPPVNKKKHGEHFWSYITAQLKTDGHFMHNETDVSSTFHNNNHVEVFMRLVEDPEGGYVGIPYSSTDDFLSAYLSSCLHIVEEDHYKVHKQIRLTETGRKLVEAAEEYEALYLLLNTTNEELTGLTL